MREVTARDFRALDLHPDDATPIGVNGAALSAWSIRQARDDMEAMAPPLDAVTMAAYLSTAYHFGFLFGWHLRGKR